MGPTWVLSAPCLPHEPCYQGCYSIILELADSAVLALVCGKAQIRFVALQGIITNHRGIELASQIAKSIGPTWDPPGSCRPQMGPMLSPWTLYQGSLPWLACCYMYILWYKLVMRHIQTSLFNITNLCVEMDKGRNRLTVSTIYCTSSEK